MAQNGIEWHGEITIEDLEPESCEECGEQNPATKVIKLRGDKITPVILAKLCVGCAETYSGQLSKMQPDKRNESA